MTAEAPISNISIEPSSTSEIRPNLNLIELATTITKESEKLEKYFRKRGGPRPGFDVDSLDDFSGLPDDIQKSREEIVRATKELGDLVTGPTESLRWIPWAVTKSFPLHETATFTQIAEKVGLDEVNVRRFMHHAMTNRIFKEVSPGVVAHTAASRVLAENRNMEDWVGTCVEEKWPAAVQTIPAILAHPKSTSPTHTGFSLANPADPPSTLFQNLSKSPARARRFANGMSSLTNSAGYEATHLVDNYAWGDIGTMVDLGGSHGVVALELCRRWPNLNAIVQDLPQTIETAPKLEGDLAQRMQFMAHSFFEEQPIKGADVYLYRWIFHNHADASCINMLRALIPSLKHGAVVLINEHCLPSMPNSQSLWDEKLMRTMDLLMLSLLNSQERTEEEFRVLFEKASEGIPGGFEFRGSKRPKGSRMSIVEAVWIGEDYGGKK
ncbi:O-methyltransferase-domain-containing protein [Xylogone sp. PMI_703]|nr:O-methyltransferase-domain-containing protein [Xylogone sp. PMI_703]